MERVAGPVDDRLEQLVPGPRGRRQAQRPRGGSGAGRAGPAARRRARTRPRRGSGRAGGTSGARSGRSSWRITIQAYGKVAAAKGCGPVNGCERGTVRKVGPRERRRRGRAPSGAVARRSRPGSGRPGARDPLAARGPAARARCSARSSSEQAGPELFELVERIRRRTIALRRDDDPDRAARASTRSSPALDLGSRRGGHPRRSRSTSSWSTSPRRAAGSGPCAGASAPRATACSTIRSPRPSPRCAGRAGPRRSSTRCSRGCRSRPVLTAHPTEARRRTDARRAAPLRGRCSSGSTTRA